MTVLGAHLNGSVNLPDTETVMREVMARVGSKLKRLPDGEPGDRQNWIFFQLQKFLGTPGLEPADAEEQHGYRRLPKVRLTAGTDPRRIVWPDLGYATAYQQSFDIFCRLRDQGVIPAAVRFQAQYPTPMASISAWVVPEDQVRLLASYQAALFADLDRLLTCVPRAQLAVQWDVAVELGILESASAIGATDSFDDIVAGLARCTDRIPDGVPVGMHLCYGDFQHRHFKDPESLSLQVRLANAVVARAGRPVSWLAFTVPQHQTDPAFFAPLAELAVADADCYFGIVPYHPARQEPGTTAGQIRQIETHLSQHQLASWGICTECGLGRVDRDEVLTLLDLHREILNRHAR